METVATQRIVIKLACIPLPVLRDRYDLTEQKFPLSLSLAWIRGFNEEYKSMETVAIDTGERRQGKTLAQWKVIMQNRFRETCIPTFRASPFG